MSNKHISLAPVAPNSEARGLLMVLWQQGLDTYDIASRVNRPESFVYNTLSRLRQLAKSEART